jgi:hypothetical protein
MQFKETDLRLAVKHLAFDMFHFRLYAEGYPKYQGKTEHNVCFQAMIYSLLLHFRVLLHFFYGTPGNDDCCVEHFRVLRGFEVAFPPSIHARPLWEEEVRIHLNKRLAHFTATRWTENAPPMNCYAARFDEVLHLIQRFETALPGEVGRHFAAEMNFWDGQYSHP